MKSPTGNCAVLVTVTFKFIVWPHTYPPIDVWIAIPMIPTEYIFPTHCENL